MTWKEAFRISRFRWAIAFCLTSILMMFLFLPAYYREIIGPKEGHFINDRVLDLFTPMNWSLPVFVILYTAVIQTLFSSLKKPDAVILGATTYCAVNLFRTLTMYAITLEPPPGMILLTDPISSILYPDSWFAKDLFFSGHISTIMILVLIEKNRIAKASKIIGTAIMGLFLVWQHVHYTIDLLAAPVVTYLIFSKLRDLLVVTEPSDQPN